ncbi:LOW QUALITY PROTEIN: protein 5NUC-like [Rhipicephalus sanguineus]|uniref:LOW QUALITY PROTEIN: protein 5NUC-like n=1 Tax=Rhipicephalus sanguineus TaxID=34632 RepID=UPI00189627F7|nr:LOW QUALITY PROTEIN: protein 5NUC-like [Rhipicephalus sanguineus]
MSEMRAASVLALVVPLLFCVRCLALEQAPFTLTVLHTNDVHAHIEESTKNGAMCSEKDKQNKSCVGGVARIKTKVKELKTQYPGALFMNAGDFFQGTAWYTVLKEKIISAVMTRMDYDYVCLGNHEFDDGPEGLAHHLLALQKANVTIVGTNTNFSDEPALRNISLPKSVKIKINNVTVGIVGAVLPETRFLSNTGKVQFEDEIQSIRREAEKLESEEVKVIVAITHSGYPRDIEIVKQVEQLDLLVGGHTNTFLYHGQGYPKENTPEGDYPTVVNRSDGSIGLVVQDYWFGKFLGFLQVSFDNNGKVTKWTGNPVLLNSSVQEDQEMLDVIDCYKENVTRAISEVIGISKVKLEQADQICRLRECTLGNLIADGFFAYYADKESSEPGMWSDVNGALFNGGAVRAPIPQNRNITMGHILATMPFGMSVVIMTLNGSELRSMFEYSVSEYSFQKKQGRFLQVSGIRVTYNLHYPRNCRVVSLQVLCRRCKVPRYETVNDTGVYKIVTTDYITKGGDGYPKATNATSGGPADYSVLVEHIRKITPVKSAIEGRITLLNGTKLAMIPGDPVTNPSLRKEKTLDARLLSSTLEKWKRSLNVFLPLIKKKISEILGK